jgi:hypothetical protein
MAGLASSAAGRRLGPILVLAVLASLLSACATLPTTPVNARASCDAVGGRFTADGRCQAGLP